MGLSRKVTMNVKYADGTVEKWCATKTFLSGVNPTNEGGKRTLPGRLVDIPEFGKVTVDSLDDERLTVTADVGNTKKETFHKNMANRIWLKLE